MTFPAATQAPEPTLAVITGSSRGVGRALATLLAARGIRLALLGRPSNEQTETERKLVEQGADVRFFPCDLAKPESLRAAADRLGDEVGVPSIVVHNAGMIERAPIPELSLQSWQRQLDVNLTAPFVLTQALLPSMLREGHGRILFVSSISAVVGTKGQSAYHAAKAGLLGLMRCLAEELSATGLMTAALLPGSVDTRMLAGSGFTPRMSPEEVAETLAFYALAASRAHNGAVIEMFGT